MTARLFYSVRTRVALASGAATLPYGSAHYSYATACSKHLQVLRSLGWRPQELVRPEIYASARHVATDDTADDPIHIIYKPFDEFRILWGASNIAAVFWEFERLPTHDALPSGHPLRDNIFTDFVRCLRLLDEVWVSSHFTDRVFKAAGIANSYRIPTPIAIAAGVESAVRESSTIEVTDCTRAALRAASMGTARRHATTGLFVRLDQARKSGGRIIVSVFNPGDSRKEPGAMLLGFQRARRRQADRLVIKLVVDGAPDALRRAVVSDLPARFAASELPFELLDCPEAMLVTGRLTDAEMAELFAMADFYLCTSSAEGQNLPMLESMAHGAVPISTATTAMEDYIDESNAFVIASRRQPVSYRIAEAYGIAGAFWNVPEPGDVGSAISAALAADTTTIQGMREAARHTVAAGYSPEAVGQLMAKRLPPTATRRIA